MSIRNLLNNSAVLLREAYFAEKDDELKEEIWKAMDHVWAVHTRYLRREDDELRA